MTKVTNKRKYLISLWFQRVRICSGSKGRNSWELTSGNRMQAAHWGWHKQAFSNLKACSCYLCGTPLPRRSHPSILPKWFYQLRTKCLNILVVVVGVFLFKPQKIAFLNYSEKRNLSFSSFSLFSTCFLNTSGLPNTLGFLTVISYALLPIM